MIDCWTAHKQSHWGTKKYCFAFLTVGLSVDTCAEQTEVFSDEERNRHTLIINPEERETVQCDSPVIIRKTMCFNDHRSFLSFFLSPLQLDTMKFAIFLFVICVSLARPSVDCQSKPQVEYFCLFSLSPPHPQCPPQ